jgi:hypothetical protein
LSRRKKEKEKKKKFLPLFGFDLTIMEDLSRDVLLLILYQLDLVSLCRLKCVSKLWNGKIPDIVFKRFVKSSFLVQDSFLATLKSESETADWLQEWNHLDSSTHFRSVQSGKPDTQCVALSQHFVFLGGHSVERKNPGIFFLPLEGIGALFFYFLFLFVLFFFFFYH